MGLFKKIATSTLSSLFVVVGSLAFSLGIQAFLLSPARSDAGIPLTVDTEERAALQAEINGCDKDLALFLKRLDLHAASAKVAYSDALKDMNPIVRSAAAAFCFVTEQEILVRTSCYARALDRMETDVSQILQLRAQPGNTGAVLLESLTKKKHFAGTVLQQQCAPANVTATDACVDQNLLALREQLVDAYNEMSAAFDEMSRWSVISMACNSNLPLAPCRAAYAARVREAQARIDEGRRKNPKGFPYNASQSDFFAPVPSSVAYDPIYVLPGLKGKFQPPVRIDTITAGRTYRSGPRKPLLPGRGPKKHVSKPGSSNAKGGVQVVQIGPPVLSKAPGPTTAHPPKSIPAHPPTTNSKKPPAKKSIKAPVKMSTPRSAPRKVSGPPSPAHVPRVAPSGTTTPSPPGDAPQPTPAGSPQPTPVGSPQPTPVGSPLPTPASSALPQNSGGAPGGQGDQPGGVAAGNIANRDHATNLDCSAEAQSAYRTEARLGWSKTSFSEMYPRRMLGQSKLYACYVSEFYAHNDQAVMLANAAMAISATAKIVLPVQSQPSIAGARRACTEAKSLIQWMDTSLSTLEQSHPRAEITPLRAEVASLSGQECMPLVALIFDDEFTKKLNDEFCAWKAAVESEEPRSTLGFPAAVAKCTP